MIAQTDKLFTCILKGRLGNYFQEFNFAQMTCSIFAAFLAVLMTGCATIPRSIQPEQVKEIKTVAVVSLLGDDFDWIEFALLRWDWKHDTQRIADWGIDASVERAARQAIRKAPNYLIVDIPEVRNELLSVTKEETGEGRKLKEADAVPLFQKFGERYNIDAIVVISRGHAQQYPLTSRLVAVAGSGIAKETTLVGLGDGRIALYSTVTVDVYSTKTLKIVASNQGFRWIHVDNTLWNKCMSEKQFSNIDGLGNTVTNMINAAVCDSLLYLKLIPESGPIKTSNSTDGARGTVPSNSTFAKITTGMSMREVYDLIGQPTSAKLYGTKNTLFPYYMGDDQARFDARYRGEGRISFRGAGPAGCKLRVFEIQYDPNDSGQTKVNNGFAIGEPFLGGYGALEW